MDLRRRNAFMCVVCMWFWNLSSQQDIEFVPLSANDLDESERISRNSIFHPTKIRPECAKNSSYCHSMDDYPLEEVERMLRNSPDNWEDLFLSVTRNLSVQEKTGFGEVKVCRTRQETTFPQQGQTDKGFWQYIVQTPIHNQSVTSEMCMYADTPCFTVADIGYETICRQNYMYFKFVTIRNSVITMDPFKFPSCCVCYIKKIEVNNDKKN